MTARFFTSAAAIAMGVVATVSAPQAVRAQPVILDDNDQCANFDWLLGTWHSYSPWGDQSQPTGGTLVFTMGAGGTVEGRIGSLNDYMEEIGYTSGQLVYRGFREVRFYDPPGVAVYHAGWSGQGQSLDMTSQGPEWREDFIGMRPGGELYQSSSAFGDFAGPYRKHDSVQEVGACRSVPESPSEEVPAQVSREALLREIIEPEDSLPPVILNPDPCYDDDLPRESLAEVMQDWLDDIERERSAEVRRALDTARYPLREMLDSLLFALMFEPIPEQRVALREQGEELRDILRRIDDEYASEAASPTLPEEQQTHRECLIKTDTVLIDLERRAARRRSAQASVAGQPGDQSPEIVSVRQDVQGLVPGLYSGEDEETRVANLRDLKTRIESLPVDDPAREELERNYRLRYSRLTQEYAAIRELQRSSDLTPELAADYAARERRLFGQMEEFGPETDAPINRLIEDMNDSINDNYDPDATDVSSIDEDLRQMTGDYREILDDLDRTPEDLLRSRAAAELQSHLDRVFVEGWSYDTERREIVPSPPSPE